MLFSKVCLPVTKLQSSTCCNNVERPWGLKPDRCSVSDFSKALRAVKPMRHCIHVGFFALTFIMQLAKSQRWIFLHHRDEYKSNTSKLYISLDSNDFTKGAAPTGTLWCHHFQERLGSALSVQRSLCYSYNTFGSCPASSTSLLQCFIQDT